MSQSESHLGGPAVNRINGRCCGKPVGCNMHMDAPEHCVYWRHPWKQEAFRAIAEFRGEPWPPVSERSRTDG